MSLEDSDYQKKADQLVASASISATSLLIPLLDSAPVLNQIIKEQSPDTWDFFATVAAVGACMLEAYRFIPEGDDCMVEKALRQALNAWDNQGYDAYLNFVKFVTQNVDAGVETLTAIGSWVLWNLKSGQPTQHELAIVPDIGTALHRSMLNSWSVT